MHVVAYLEDIARGQPSKEDGRKGHLKLVHASYVAGVEPGNKWFHEGDIEQRHEGVDELKHEGLGDQRILEVDFGAVILPTTVRLI